MNFRYQKKTFLLFSACLLIATLFSPIHQPTAAPDKTSSFLLSEPVSMMTFGLYRVNEELVNKFYKEKSFAEDMNVYANYFPGSDLIFIFLHGSWYETKRALIDACTTAINKIRKFGGVDLKTGRLISHQQASLYSLWFEPTYRDRSQEFYRALDSKFFIECDARIQKEIAGPSKPYYVSGRLVSNEILLRDEGVSPRWFCY